MIKFIKNLPLSLNIKEFILIYKKNKSLALFSKIKKDLISEGSKVKYAHCIGKVFLGKNVSINGPGTVISSFIEGIEIKSYTSIGPNVSIIEHLHKKDNVTTYFMEKNYYQSKDIRKDIISKGKITIEEDVWIGANSVVLSGVKIGRGSIIGAGSIVTKNIPKYSIALGNPAKVVKMRFSKDEILNIENSKWWEWSEEKIIKNKEFFRMKRT